MDSLVDILHGKDFDEPEEIRNIKAYVRRHYDADVRVAMQQRAIVVTAPSAGLIGSLRLNIAALQKAANTEKKILLRIASS